KEVRRIEHTGPRRLERRASARRSWDGRSGAQAGVGKGTARGRSDAPLGVGGAGIDRRVRVRRAAETRRPWADVVRGAFEGHRLEAGGPAGVQLGGGGDAI